MSVAKVQKGFQLPPEVANWIDAEEAATGATLSRLATAAFCSLRLMGSIYRSSIMNIAVRVEREEIRFDEIDIPYWTAVVERLQNAIKDSRGHDDLLKEEFMRAQIRLGFLEAEATLEKPKAATPSAAAGQALDETLNKVGVRSREPQKPGVGKGKGRRSG